MTAMLRGRELDPTGCERLLARILASTPAMSDAPCIGHSNLFDARAHGETLDRAEARHHHAAALCRRCPHITACQEYTAGLRDVGMVRAGIRPELRGAA